jgi:hypothetical protein
MRPPPVEEMLRLGAAGLNEAEVAADGTWRRYAKQEFIEDYSVLNNMRNRAIALGADLAGTAIDQTNALGYLRRIHFQAGPDESPYELKEALFDFLTQRWGLAPAPPPPPQEVAVQEAEGEEVEEDEPEVDEEAHADEPGIDEAAVARDVRDIADLMAEADEELEWLAPPAPEPHDGPEPGDEDGLQDEVDAYAESLQGLHSPRHYTDYSEHKDVLEPLFSKFFPRWNRGMGSTLIKTGESVAEDVAF